MRHMTNKLGVEQVAEVFDTYLNAWIDQNTYE